METMSAPRILMCPPDYFGIEYEINPWMNVRLGSDAERARRQWNALRLVLEELGVLVELVEPVAGLPDLVFTANAGLVYGKLFISSRFRYGVRQGEAPHFEGWRGAEALRSSYCPRVISSRGRAMPCFAGRRCLRGTGFAATSAATNGSATGSDRKFSLWN